MDFDKAARHYMKQKAAKVKRLTIKERMAVYAAWVEDLRREGVKDDQKTF